MDQSSKKNIHRNTPGEAPKRNTDKFSEDIKNCLEVLKKGGIILYPTDTIWGIGCDATNPEAVKKIYALKKREETQSMLVLVENANRVGRYVKQIPEVAIQLIEVNDQPMTLIYPGAVNLAPNILPADHTIGIRITSDEFCQKLIAALNKPLVSTSANISGEPSPKNFKEITEDIKNGVDYIVKWRQKDPASGAPSSIIKVGLKGEVEIIRP